MNIKETSYNIIVLTNLMISIRDSIDSIIIQDHVINVLPGFDVVYKIRPDEQVLLMHKGEILFSIDGSSFTTVGINTIGSERITIRNKNQKLKYYYSDYNSLDCNEFDYPSTVDEWECKLFQLSTSGIDDSTLDNIRIGWYLINTTSIKCKTLRLYRCLLYSNKYGAIIEALNNWRYNNGL